jgi:hypothetical protein
MDLRNDVSSVLKFMRSWTRPPADESLLVSRELEGGLVTLRYDGRHACTEDAHSLDGENREFLQSCLMADVSGVLIDVRNLEVVYPSGLSDLVCSWGPAFRASANPSQCAFALLVSEGSRLASRLDYSGLLKIFRAYSTEEDCLEYLGRRSAPP